MSLTDDLREELALRVTTHVHEFVEDGLRWRIECAEGTRPRFLRVPVAFTEVLASRVPSGPTSPWPRTWEARP